MSKSLRVFVGLLALSLMVSTSFVVVPPAAASSSAGNISVCLHWFFGKCTAWQQPAPTKPTKALVNGKWQWIVSVATVMSASWAGSGWVSTGVEITLPAYAGPLVVLAVAIPAASSVGARTANCGQQIGYAAFGDQAGVIKACEDAGLGFKPTPAPTPQPEPPKSGNSLWKKVPADVQARVKPLADKAAEKCGPVTQLYVSTWDDRVVVDFSDGTRIEYAPDKLPAITKMSGWDNH